MNAHERCIMASLLALAELHVAATLDEARAVLASATEMAPRQLELVS